ncbi:MAG: glycosyltransferase family 2 protein [Planctomycetes bacterium]|nr:glycosyltransferase family 2 protein [Planctomycetota bacterium]
MESVDTTGRGPFRQVCAVVPALDEEGSIGPVIERLSALGIGRVVIGDNGSTDRTAAIATAAGAMVVAASRRGYGSACQAALAAVPADMVAVVFCDADGADDLDRLAEVVGPVLSGDYDLVIGSRVLGGGERGALTWPQRMGNLVAAAMMRVLYRARVTDLGPFRCVSTRALEAMAMRDPAFGWTAEMQVKAYRLRLRVMEVPVRALARTAGTSKISGRFVPVFLAGWAILSTIWRYRSTPLPGAQTCQRASAPARRTCEDLRHLR